MAPPQNNTPQARHSSEGLGKVGHWLASRVPYLYLLRVQLLTLTALVGLPALAFATPASSVLANLFDVPAASAWVVTMLALGTAWTALFTTSLVAEDGPIRLGVAPLGFLEKIRGRDFVIFALLALPVAVGVYHQSTSQGTSEPVVALASLVLGVAPAVLLLRVSVPFAELLGRALYAAVVRLIPEAWLESGADWVLADPDRGAGLFEYDSNNRQTGLTVVSGHQRALAFLMVSLVLYFAVGLMKYLRLGGTTYVPTLAYVLLLLTLICWALAGLAFWADRHRIPLLLPLAALAVVTSFCPLSDHYFRTRDVPGQTALAPRDALRAGGRTSVILVAASGGGIQAAAWTARVLVGLEENARRECGPGCADFGESVRLISSVSGGSVGAMYFLNAYRAQGLPEDDDLEGVVENAEASSLDEVAWGLVYPDLTRVLLPGFPFLPRFEYIDRGWALQHSFGFRARGVRANLSTWRDSVRAGWRPASIFNATIADTGERLLFATTDLEQTGEALQTFSRQFPGRDVAIATAARLSATFPYVTPAARADAPGVQFHVVDGGYYDNFGVSSLIAWLREALDQPDNPVRRVLVIEIRGARDVESHLRRNRRGSLYQLYAPLATMFHVRTAGQLANNVVAMELLKRASFPDNPRIHSVVFEFCGEDPPLSWHLTKKQKDAVRKEWESGASVQSGWPIVRKFLAGEDDIPEQTGTPCAQPVP